MFIFRIFGNSFLSSRSGHCFAWLGGRAPTLTPRQGPYPALKAGPLPCPQGRARALQAMQGGAGLGGVALHGGPYPQGPMRSNPKSPLSETPKGGAGPPPGALGRPCEAYPQGPRPIRRAGSAGLIGLGIEGAILPLNHFRHQSRTYVKPLQRAIM